VRSRLRVVIPSAAVILAAASTQAETNAWKREISLGFNLKQGNTESQQANAKLEAKRKDAWDMAAEFSYGETDNEVTSDDAKGHIEYIEPLSARLYGSLRVSAEYDGPADLRYRIVIGPAIGAYLFDTNSHLLKIEIGPSYVSETAGEEHKEYGSIRVAERYERTWSDGSKIWQSTEYLPDIADGNNYVLHNEVGLEAAVEKQFSLKVTVQHTYTAEPAVGKKPSDLAMISSLSYKF
jgi:putative salt-induced outer membrane protein YdiY